MKKIVLTQSALEKVLSEKDQLIVKRKEISEEIKKARAFGDLSENAEYHAAREAQSLNESEILKLTAIIENHTLVDENDNKEIVNINSKLKIKYLDDSETDDIQIVSQIESDPFEGKLSNESPIGNGLIGHKAGDTVEIIIPDGIIKIEILEIL